MVVNKSIKSNRLTEIDILAFYAGLRNTNIIAPLILHVLCDKEDCQKEFKITVNLDDIIANCKKYKPKVVEFEKEIDGVLYSFELSEPSFKELIEFEQYMILLYLKNQHNYL